MNPKKSPQKSCFALCLSAAVFLCTGLAGAPSLAQDWPTKPVKIVVPFAAGGNTDSIARLVAERLTSALGQSVIVENRAGGNGVIAAQAVASAAPDGYTLMMAPMPVLAILPVVMKVPYDAFKSFTPISNVGSNPFVLGVNKAVPANTLGELVNYVKANPGKVNYASGGSGSVSHLSAVLFAQRAKLDMAAVADLIGGHVQMYFGNLSELAPHYKAGTIKIVGVSSEKRNKALPDVPTFAEAGFPGFRTVTWNGLVAPAGTPPEIVAKVAGEVTKIAKTPSFAAQLANIGVDAIGSSPAQFAETLKQDVTLWSDAARAAKLTNE
jgi:tripartite-type tricarboxylate transporter receptor subunit TctC